MPTTVYSTTYLVRYTLQLRLVNVCTSVQLWVELVSKELDHLAAILHVYAGGLIFMK